MSRIVHLGLGAFFRAHGAIYTQEAGGWRICGVSLRSPGTRDVLQGQGWGYTAASLSGEVMNAQRIDVLEEVLVAPESPQAVLAKMADAETKIVSLTITEKGYCHDAKSGRLNKEHPDIQADLRTDTPITAVGYIVAALRRRQDAGLAPFTVLSLDNLPGNGQVIRDVTLDFAALKDPALADWIATNGAFPCTMVDRIVPATTAESISALEAATGIIDPAMVQHEPYRQWVIEDNFVNNIRPDWDVAGATIVADVVPYEDMKLRMLNGAHSALAYLGVLAGRETVFDAITDQDIGEFIERLWKDALIPSITPPDGLNLTTYATQLRDRFANPGIRHMTSQIAMDGSQKLPQRILAPLRDIVASGGDPSCLATVLAAWIRSLGGQTDAGKPITVSDPMAAEFGSALARCTSAGERVEAILAIDSIFGPYPVDAIRTDVTTKLTQFETIGAIQTLQQEQKP